jgi:hypothetical protein
VAEIAGVIAAIRMINIMMTIQQAEITAVLREIRITVTTIKCKPRPEPTHEIFASNFGRLPVARRQRLFDVLLKPE